MTASSDGHEPIAQTPCSDSPRLARSNSSRGPPGRRPPPPLPLGRAPRVGGAAHVRAGAGGVGGGQAVRMKELPRTKRGESLQGICAIGLCPSHEGVTWTCRRWVSAGRTVTNCNADGELAAAGWYVGEQVGWQPRFAHGRYWARPPDAPRVLRRARRARATATRPAGRARYSISSERSAYRERLGAGCEISARAPKRAGGVAIGNRISLQEAGGARQLGHGCFASVALGLH
jgi:hypothetical protein